jgi:hypothetical protein
MDLHQLRILLHGRSSPKFSKGRAWQESKKRASQYRGMRGDTKAVLKKGPGPCVSVSSLIRRTLLLLALLAFVLTIPSYLPAEQS